MNKSKKSKKDINAEITQVIIEKLEEGKIPWKKEWSTSKPLNIKTKKEYRGINIFLLAMAGYTSPYFGTFKQFKEIGGNVKKGQKGHRVVFWKWLVIDDKNKSSIDNDDNKKMIPMLRHYTVFNIEQCENVDMTKVPTLQTFDNKNENIEKAENIIKNMPNPPQIKNYGGVAFYRPATDMVVVPELKNFFNSEGFYATTFHELGHATGHQSRLARKGIMESNKFGSIDYSKEELVAELASAFLCAESNISNVDTVQNTVSYIRGWLSKLKDDKNLIVLAAAQAQKASDYILDHKEVGKEK